MSRFRFSALTHFALIIVLCCCCECVPEDPSPPRCIPGQCDDGDSCTTDTCIEPDDGAAVECSNTPIDCPGGQTCHPDTGVCVSCFEDADCTDEVFCNGVEICDSNGQCQPGTDPCPGRHCREGGETCVDCLTNAHCDDADFCNGAEICGADGQCQAGLAPCTPPQVCDEASDRCVECIEDATCPDDGRFCTGDPACVNNECGFSGSPCQAGEICDEDSDRCVECTSDAQCEDNEECMNGACMREPCTTDFDCVDGKICDQESGDCLAAPEGATRGLPTCYEPGESFTVRIVLNPANDTLAVGLQDSPPSGWTVSNISHDGEWDATNAAVKWFFLDDQTRTLAYEVTPRGNAAGSACFGGQVNSDGGTDQDMAGGACIDKCPGN